MSNYENTDDNEQITEGFLTTNEGLIPPKPIEKHVRGKARTFDPESPEWYEQVESLVDEVMEEVDPDIPEESRVISHWVRQTAAQEIERGVEVNDD